MDIHPKSLILNLLLATDEGVLSTAEAVRAAQLFEIGSGNIRVTFTRLISAGLLDAAGRGLYRLSAKGEVLASTVANWRYAEQRTLAQWDGSWVGVLTTDLPKAERTAWRPRARTLAMLGFRELHADLHIRPNNLKGGVPHVRKQLESMDGSRGLAVFSMLDLEPQSEQKARSLWDVKALRKRYRTDVQRLERWIATADEVPLERAAREAYLMGNSAIREMVFDPLLPEPLVDVRDRQKLIETVIRYEQFGRIIWRRFLKS